MCESSEICLIILAYVECDVFGVGLYSDQCRIFECQIRNFVNKCTVNKSIPVTSIENSEIVHFEEKKENILTC